jgi:glycerol-3-phosphate dehydrogenase (NAD(P)+)
MLGRGEKIEDILSNMVMVAEGVPTVKAVYEIAKDKGISMPIVESLYRVIYEGASIKEIISFLMERELKEEFY